MRALNLRLSSGRSSLTRRRLESARTSETPTSREERNAMARMAELTERDQLAESDREVFDYVIGSRGRMGLPYSVFMNHPQLAKLKLQVGHFVRFDTSLPGN